MLADILRIEGDLERAEVEALAALDFFAVLPFDRVAATATLAAIRLARGRTAEALATAEAAVVEHRALGLVGFRGAFVRLVHVECLRAAGDLQAARGALVAARARLLESAEKIGDASFRRSFLENVPENARTLALADELLGEQAEAFSSRLQHAHRAGNA